jgi:hypothetical protein
MTPYKEYVGPKEPALMNGRRDNSSSYCRGCEIFLPSGEKRLRCTVSIGGASWIVNCFSASTCSLHLVRLSQNVRLQTPMETHFSHLYLSAPFRWSMLTNLRRASRSESHLKISRLRSNMRSNVSLLCPQSRHVTLERRRPPNSLWTQVVSAILASNLLQKKSSQGW